MWILFSYLHADFARYHCAMTQESFTNAVAVSSCPAYILDSSPAVRGTVCLTLGMAVGCLRALPGFLPP